MQQEREMKGSKILFVKDEKEFYSLIEERMEKQGFKVFETSLPSTRDSDFFRFF